METNKIITLQDLIDKNACEKGIKWFQENFGEETDIETLKNKLIEKKEWDYLEWLFKKLKLTGKYISFYENGKIMTKCFFKDGKLEGEYIYFYEDGQVWTKCFFKDGKLEGKYISFYTNGEVREKCYYENGKKIS